MTTATTKYQNVVEREKLIATLHEAVKQCQIRFGGKKELATEIDKRVNFLCNSWDNVFLHGLRNCSNNKAISAFKQLTHVTGLNKIKINAVDDFKNLEADSGFWGFVKEHLSRHELQRYQSLKSVTTDSGRGFAWLRSALNEHSLEKYIQMMIGAPEILRQFYEDWALMRDEEKSSLLPNMAAGLCSILFAISIDNSSLNMDRSIAVTPLFSIGSTNASRRSDPLDDDVVLVPTVVKTALQGDNKREKKRKKKPAKIVTFDNEDFSSCSGSPASCLVSPQEKPVPVVQVSSIKNVSAIDVPTGVPPNSLPPVDKELKSGTTGSNSPDADKISEPFRAEHPDRFSFDIFELQNATESRNQTRPELEAEYDSSGKCSAELNGFLSDTSGSKEVSVVENLSKTAVTDEDVHVGSLESRPTSTPKQNFSYLSGKGSSDVNLRRNVVQEIGSLGLNSAPSHRSVEDLRRTLPHSDSVTSNTSLSSSGSKFNNFMTCETDAEISLVPLNSEGRPIDLDETNAGSVDGDTSESYGSYDSHELPYGDFLQKATRAVGDAEKAFSNSFRRQLDIPTSITSVQESSNCLADGLAYEDLKQALIAMMLRKDDAEDLNRRLQVALDAERQSATSLRKEIEDKRVVELHRQEKDAEKSRALMRENELLKNQLKKYIGAVQMLRQGASVDGEALPGISADSPQPIIPPSRSSIDYSYEASEYEKKLIQVAEMHGELMEFNELLQRQLVIREAQLKRITAELVSLRGPLPSEITPQEVEAIASSSATSNFLSLSPSLVNVWIPSAFLKGSSTDAYHVYQVYIHIRNEEWNIYRRYAEFFELHCKLKKKYPAVSVFDFPPKKTFGKKDPKIVEVRRKKLETYLRHVIHHLTEKLQRLAEHPSRQLLTSILPFFGDETKPEKTKHRTRRSSERTSRASALRSSSSSEALNFNADRNAHQYMGL